MTTEAAGQPRMHPNFTGVWKLIRGESKFGFLPPPRQRIDMIEHEDLQLRVLTRQKDANGSLTVQRNLTIGAEAVKIMILDRPRWIRAFWDEAALVVETKSEVSGAARRIKDRWTLDSDVEWLTQSNVCTNYPAELYSSASASSGANGLILFASSWPVFNCVPLRHRQRSFDMRLYEWLPRGDLLRQQSTGESAIVE